MKPKHPPIEQRFWKRVDRRDPDQCWEWTGKRLHGQYGALYVGNKTILAHRFSYQLHFGEIPQGLFVCHKCDNPCCVNPGHLFLGTAKDNIRDMINKGRSNWTIGSVPLPPQTKLTIAQVKEIREKYQPRVVTANMLSKEYGVSRIQINRIVHFMSWKEA